MKRFVFLGLAVIAQGCASVDTQQTRILVSPKGAQVEVLVGGKRTVDARPAAPVVSDTVKGARYELAKEIVRVRGQVAIEIIKAQSQHR